MRKLNAAQCKTIKKPGMYRADDTLYLCVKPTGRKSWVQRIVVDGRRRNLGLGPYPVVSLSQARQRAFENRVKVELGKDPLADKRKARAPLFKDAAASTHASLKPTWKSRHTETTWLQVLNRYAMPKIGNLPVDRITEADVLAILKPIWTEKPETARRVKRRIRAVLEWCREHGHILQNVADNPFKTSLPAMPKVKENYRALDYREVPEALKAIEAGVNSLPAQLCLKFLILTATRSNEAREATWKEIDLKEATWEIPASRMKQARPHRIPLSKSALAVLEQAKELRNNSDLLFPSHQNPGQPLSSEFCRKHFKKLGLWERTTIHGFRTSFRTWASERTDIPREVCELALAHMVGNAVEQAYSRSDLLEKRITLMRLWDEFLTRF